MKVTPLAAGTGVPAQSNASLSQTADASKLARAKAIAMGQAPVEAAPQRSGDPQVDKINTRRIKMKTQMSTNRDSLPEDVASPQLVDNDVDNSNAQSPTTDTVEPAQGTEETKPLSPQFAALAKAKRALQVKERELAQREEALKSQTPAGNEDWKSNLKANPLGVLQEVIGPDVYAQLTEAILNDQNKPISQADIDALVEKKLNERLDKEFGTRDQQSEQQVLGEIRREAMALTAEGDQYEAIRAAKAQNDVVELVHRTWKTTGEVMSTAEAAELVENQLIDEAIPFAKLNKVQSRITPAQEKFIEKILDAPKPNTKIMRTLTNRDTAPTVVDRRARAIAAMEGRLKKG